VKKRRPRRPSALGKHLHPPRLSTSGELLIDCEEDGRSGAVLIWMMLEGPLLGLGSSKPSHIAMRSARVTYVTR
jgi:hypothetical protein